MNYRAIYALPKSWNLEEASLLDDAVSFANNYSGVNFFNDVCIFISKSLQVKYVLIGKVTSDSFEEVQTQGFACQGQAVPSHQYRLHNTPCEHVLLHRTCFYPKNVQAIFSENTSFAALGIQSYMGVSLNDLAENRLGLVALMHDKSFDNPSLAETFITILSPRIEEELQRMLDVEV
ncbi:hypothetical protein [Pontibacter rugosus]|uniref:GAF domain-containing protein n=1 Tax=Pontibacter rugosus TaxID=1745966 RepID=A0ABW3ST66_9BACT